MRLKMLFKRGLIVAVIYTLAILCILMMADHVERLEEKERLESKQNIAIKIDK